MKARKPLQAALALILTFMISVTTFSFTLEEAPVDPKIEAAASELLSVVEDFTIVALPDTQHYSMSYPLIFDNQTQWVVSEAESMNVVFVTHEGDIIQLDELAQWQNANHSLRMLDDHVPWGVLPGNHDGLEWGGSLANYDTFFGVARFSGESWYGGGYFGSNANNYEFFSGGGDDYLIFHFQYNPSDAVLTWANETIESHPNRKVIVTTHNYLLPDGNRSATGENIWSKFVAPHADQVFLVLCGHEHGEARRTDTVNGHVVYQLLANYQDRANGGNGFLRILKFSPAEDKIYVSTYSPYLNSYEADSDSQFELYFDMTETTRAFFEHVIVDDADYANVRSIGDVDGDGFSDVIAAKTSSGLTWYRYPDWTKHSIYSFNWGAEDIESADIDGDGDVDVVGAQDDDWKVYWFENPRPSGNPAEDPWISHYIGSSSNLVKDLEIADFNKDGKLDVAARTGYTTSVFLQDGVPSGNLLPNGDFESGTTTGWSIYKSGTAQGTITTSTDVPADGGVYSGKETVTAFASGDLIALQSKFEVTGLEGQTLTVSFKYKTSGLAPFNVFIIAYDASETQCVYQYPCTPTSTWTENSFVTSALPTTLSSTRQPWIDFRLYSTGTLYIDDVAVVPEDTTTQWNKVKTISHHDLDGLDVGDLDEDGDLDLVLNGFWLENPHPNLSGTWVEHNIDSKWWNQDTGDSRDNNAKVYVTDVNEDSSLDVVISQSEKPGYPVSWYEASNPKTGPWIGHVIGYFDYCHTLQVGDMDNDGDLDVVTGKFERDLPPLIPPPYRLRVYYNKNGDGLSWDAAEVSDLGIYTAVIGDIGNDGDLDIVGSRSYWKGPIEIWENTVNDVYPVYLFITVEPSQSTYMEGQSLTFTVNVFNLLNPSFEGTLTLTVTGPGDYYVFDFEGIGVAADVVGEFGFGWVVPDVAGTYVVEVSLVPPLLTAYDAVWLEAV